MSGIKIIRRNDNNEQQESVKQLYDKKIEKIISKMPKKLSFEEKVDFLYSFLVNDLGYDYECLERTANDTGLVTPTFFADIDDESVPSTYRGYSNTSDPISAFLHRKALCAATSKIFKDLCNRAGIKCEICNGKTAIVDDESGVRRGHAWNIVEDEYGRRSHVDVTYGRFVKDNHEFENCKDRKLEDFSMVSDEDLVKRGPHTFEKSVSRCNYTVTNHQQIKEKILSKLNEEELDTDDIQH